MNLYHISARYQQLLDQDELTGEELAELQALHTTVEDACIDRAKYIKNLEAEKDAVDKAICEMTDRISALTKKINEQREKLIGEMKSNKLDTITTPNFKIHWKENPVKVDDYNLSLIPGQYWYETVPKPVAKIDKVAIKQDIEKGIDVPGARLIRSIKLDIK